MTKLFFIIGKRGLSWTKGCAGSRAMFLLLSALALTLVGQDNGLVFRATFNAYTTVPEVAVEKAPLPQGIPQDLQLRMFPNIKGDGNSVCLHRQEYISYSTKNISPEEGSVSLWICPQNWSFSESRFAHSFLDVRNDNYRLLICKQKDYENTVTFYLKVGQRVNTVQATITKPAAGEWHHLVANWKRTRMELYVDGRLASPKQSLNFPEPLSLPKTVENCSILINDPTGWRHQNPDWTTAYDDLEIYSRCLSQQEVTAKYEAYFPSNFGCSLPRPTATIPAGKPIRLDASLAPGEWEDATMLPILNGTPERQRKAPFFFTVLYLKTCGNTLCAAARISSPVTRHEYTKRDGSLWQDDSFDLLLQPADGKTRHFIINSNGTLYDSLSSDAKWDSTATAKAQRNDGGWCFEFSVPLQELGLDTGSPLEQQTMKGNFGVTVFLPHAVYRGWSRNWGFGTSFATPEFFGQFRFGGEAVQFKGLDALDSTRLTLAYSSAAQLTGEAKWESISGQHGRANTALFGDGWSSVLPNGPCIISSELKNGRGETVYSMYLLEDIKKSLEVSFRCHYLEKTLFVHLDYSEAAKGSGYGGKVQIVGEKDGKEYVVAPFRSTSPQCVVELPYGDSLPLNTDFLVKATVDAEPPVVSSVLFRTPDTMTFPQYEVNHDVPEPWKKVARVRGNTFKVLDRNYTFDKGAIPNRIESRGETVLEDAPVFTLNGKPVQWNPVQIGQNHGDYIVIQGTGQTSEARFDCRGELWFDGMYAFTFTMRPVTDRLDIESFRLAWSTPARNAHFVFTPVLQPWQGDTMELEWNTQELHSLFWTAGHENGLAWWNASDANWVIDKNRRQIFLKRNVSTVDVTVNIIDGKATLAQEAKYTMVFQGTPPRHRERQWRNRYYGCSIPFSNFCIGSGSTAKGQFLPDNLTYHTNLIPAHPELFGKYYRDRHYTHGQDFCIYTFPPHLSRMDRIYDTCFPTWATTPGIRWEAKDEFSGERFFNEPVCSCTPACDRIVAQAHDILADNPYVHGIYFDISHVVSCNNALHGHGGTDAFGKKFATSEALDMRHFFLRIYKLHRKYPDKYMMLHAHNKYYPFVHDFADVWCPGEELFESYCEKPYWYYMEEVSPEAYQSAWNGKIRGVAIQMIPQEERALVLMDSMKVHKDWIPTEATVIRRLSACMLHDINCWENFWCLKKNHPLGILRGINRTLTMEDATFHGYWLNSTVTTENPATKVSWYSWDGFASYKRVLVIVNTTRTPTTPCLKINWEAFGMDSRKASFHDLWNDQPTTLDKIQSTTIPPNCFLYIGVR